MKKGPNLTKEKILELKGGRKLQHQIKFNLSPCNLACFKGKEKAIQSKCKIQSIKQSKTLSQLKPEAKNTDSTKRQEPFTKERERALSCKSNFNEQVVFMQYGNIDVYIDNSNCKKSNGGRSNQSSQKVKSDGRESFDEEIVTSCVRVITEETDNTSNAFSLHTPSQLTPRSSQMFEYYQISEFYDPKMRTPRNKRSVTIEEGKIFIIDFQNIEHDGRTTVMVKNIPNKYTQQSLLQEISINHQNRFDFFYLPIDKDNDCNVGYAFINFVNATYLKEFFAQFHQKKWKKYKSPKICNICYARYQGTLELANHFRHSKILQHKDRKFKPLIGITQTNRIKNIEEMIKNQRGRQQKQV